MAWDTLWLFLTIFEVCGYSGDVEGIRAGITVILCGIWAVFTNDVYAYFAEQKRQLTILSADFSNWSNPVCVNANVYVLILVFAGIMGILLIGWGVLKNRK